MASGGGMQCVIGATEIEARLKDLGAKMGGKIVRGAMRKAMLPIADDARRRARPPIAPAGPRWMKRKTPKDSAAHLAENIKVSSGVRKSGEVRATVKCGGGWYKGQQFYGAMVEFGHHIGKRQSGGSLEANKRAGRGDKYGDTRGSVIPHPFMRPAFEQGKDEAAATAVDLIAKGIDKFWDKLEADVAGNNE